MIPLAMSLKVGAVGANIIKDPAFVNSMSRSGRPSELLYGPLTYGVIFVASTLIYWRHSPGGVLAMLLLCVGDGYDQCSLQLTYFSVVLSKASDLLGSWGTNTEDSSAPCHITNRRRGWAAYRLSPYLFLPFWASLRYLIAGDGLTTPSRQTGSQSLES